MKRGRSTLPWGGDLSPPEESEERSRRTHSDAGSDDKLLASSISRTPADLASISGTYTSYLLPANRFLLVFIGWPMFAKAIHFTMKTNISRNA